MVGKIKKKVTAFAFAVIFAGSLNAQIVWFDDGGVHSLNSSFSEAIGIDDGPGGLRTIFTFNPGAVVGNYDGSSVQIYGSSTVITYGGQFSQDFVAAGNSTATIFNGVFQNDLYAAEGGSVTFIGGSVADDIEVFGQGSFTMTGGSVGEDFEVRNDGFASISGGSVARNVLAEDGFMSISGGTFSNTGTLTADGGTIRLSGTNFRVNGTIVSAGNLLSTEGLLSGTLLDGSSFSMYFYRYNGGTIEVSGAAIPEPAHVGILLGAGAIAFAFWRRKSQRNA
jgi:hypothetical protein